MVVAKRGRLTPAPFLLFLALAGSSCGGTPPPVSGNPSSQQQIQWERIKSWSGSGSQSGRPLTAPVIDHTGEGKGTAYVSEEPRVFFANVLSQGLEWKISVSERVR